MLKSASIAFLLIGFGKDVVQQYFRYCVCFNNLQKKKFQECCSLLILRYTLALTLILSLLPSHCHFVTYILSLFLCHFHILSFSFLLSLSLFFHFYFDVFTFTINFIFFHFDLREKCTKKTEKTDKCQFSMYVCRPKK